MNPFGPVSRGLALAAILMTWILVAAPARAAQADIDLLHSYIGSWKGTGVITGDRSETVRCNLSLTPGNENKVNYNGRCTAAGQRFNIRGTLAFIESKRRYEAVMTSVSSFKGVAVGQKRGNGVLFNLKDARSTDEAGNEVTISAEIALQAGKINVGMNVVFNDTGDSLEASVPFTK